MNFLLRRFSFYFLAFLVAVTVNFFLPRMLPGDPVEVMLGPLMAKMTPESLQALKDVYGFSDAPLWQQYFSYLGSILQGDFGISIRYYPEPVTAVLLTGLKWTLFLLGTSTIISFVIGSALGVLAAWWRGRIFDTVATPLAIMIQGVPQVVVCLILLWTFGVTLQWFPTSYAYDPDLDIQWSMEFIRSVLYHSALPLLTLVICGVGTFLIPMRANLINLLGEEYITLARAKGLSQTRIMFAYAARNALLPSLTTLAMVLGFVVGGSFIIEVVFNYPGMGYLMFQALQMRDYPLIQGHLLIFTLVMLSVNFLVDVLYRYLDPRARLEATQ